MSPVTWPSRTKVQLDGEILARGTRRVVTLPVLTDLDGAEIALTVHAVVGAHPGPTLVVHTALHGSEWQPIQAIRDLLDDVVPEDLHGALLLLPVANPIALASRTRNLRDESDGQDLNRAFGGEQTWLADQLAQAISTHLLTQADAVIDFHCGLWGAAMYSVTVGTDFTDPAVSAASFELARSFGFPYIRTAELATRFPGPRSSVGYAGQVLGVPSMVVEIGGVGFDPEIEARWRETTRRGLRNVLRGLGMVAGEPELPPQLLVFQRVKRVNPRHGGMIEPLISADEMMVREVQAGELLGRVWSPYTFETLEELRAPFRGLLDMAPHARPARPGDWAYLVVDLDDPRTKWIDARAGQP